MKVLGSVSNEILQWSFGFGIARIIRHQGFDALFYLKIIFALNIYSRGNSSKSSTDAYIRYCLKWKPHINLCRLFVRAMFERSRFWQLHASWKISYTSVRCTHLIESVWRPEFNCLIANKLNASLYRKILVIRILVFAFLFDTYFHVSAWFGFITLCPSNVCATAVTHLTAQPASSSPFFQAPFRSYNTTPSVLQVTGLSRIVCHIRSWLVVNLSTPHFFRQSTSRYFRHRWISRCLGAYIGPAAQPAAAATRRVLNGEKPLTAERQIDYQKGHSGSINNGDYPTSLMNSPPRAFEYLTMIISASARVAAVAATGSLTRVAAFTNVTYERWYGTSQTGGSTEQHVELATARSLRRPARWVLHYAAGTSRYVTRSTTRHDNAAVRMNGIGCRGWRRHAWVWFQFPHARRHLRLRNPRNRNALRRRTSRTE